MYYYTRLIVILFVFLGLFAATSVFSENQIQIKVVKGQEIAPYVADITNLCLTVYREPPYLYEGTVEEYGPFIQKYTESPESIVCLIMDGNDVVGATTGTPLSEMREHYTQSFLDNGYSLPSFYYIGEMVILPEYRGKGYGKSMYQEMEKNVRAINQFPYLCFCEIEQPNQIQKSNQLIIQNGYVKHEELSFNIDWLDIGETEVSPHHLVYWIKSLN